MLMADWLLTTSVDALENMAAQSFTDAMHKNVHLQLNADVNLSGVTHLDDNGVLFPQTLDQLAAHELLHGLVNGYLAPVIHAIKERYPEWHDCEEQLVDHLARVMERMAKERD